MRRLAVALVLAGAFRLAAQSGLPMVPPDAELVLGIEWRRVIDSPVGVAMTDQLEKSELSRVPAIKSLQAALLRNVDSILIASPLSGIGGSAQTPGLLIAKGRFDVAQLRALLVKKGQVVEKYHTVELLVPPESSPKPGAGQSRVALLNGSTVIGGDRAQVRAAIDRAAAGRVAHTGILEGAAELAAANDLWMILNIPAVASKDARMAMTPVLSTVKSAELGVSFKDGLTMRLNVRAKDDASAQSLAQMAQGAVAMAALNQDQVPPASLEMMRKIRIKPEGSLVRLELALDRSEFEKILKEAQTPRPAAPPPTARRAAAEPSGPKSIKIYGLDNGTVEVPLPQTKK